MILTKEYLNYSRIQIILVCLIPLGLIFSRFFADFFLVLVCLTFLIQSYSKKNNYFNNYFFKVFLLFWTIITLKSFFSEDIFFSLKSSLPYVRFGIFSLAIYYLFSINQKYFYYFYLSLSFCLIILVFDGYFQYFVGENVFGYPITINKYNEDIRLSSFFREELILGSFISRIFPFYLGLYFFCESKNLIKKRDLLMFVFLLSSLILVLLSGERVAFAYISLSFLISLYFFKLPIKKFTSKIFFGLAILMFIIVSNKDVKNRFIETTFSQIGITQSALEKTDQGEKYIFSIHHHNHIIAAYKIFKENMIFGSGVKMFRKICDKRYKINAFSCSTHPHNTVMQFLSETGIIGIIFYFACLIYILKSFLKNFKIAIKDMTNSLLKSKIFFLVALFIPLIPVLPSGNFFNNWLSIIAYFPIGFYLITKKENNEF